MTILVAGSGPAGAFAALGALQAGASVVMIDPGLAAEQNARQLKEKLGARPWQSWTPEERSALKGTSTLSRRQAFGSDFPTRPAHAATIQEKNCRIMQSNALGGLSNIWGRGIEPPYGAECDQWNFKEGFIESMREVLKHIPLSAEADNLAEVMPLHTENITPHRITKESETLLQKWNRHKTSLNQSGVHFGKTRLAMRPQQCQLCGMCFYGCPYGAMFDSGEIISALLRQYPAFSYRPGLRVKTFAAAGDNVDVRVENIEDRTCETLQGKKLILAAGAAQTTAIVMRSLGVRQATLKNSDLIKIPLFKIFGRSQPEVGYHALSQLTLTVDHRKITRKAIVIHLFGKNPAIRDAIVSPFPRRCHALLEKILAPLFSRLFIGMCFLHSDDSAEIEVTDDGKMTTFSGRRKPGAWGIYWQLLLFFLMHMRKLGLLPLPGSLGLPGSSVHYGASVAADDAGQLTAASSVYVADAASLPCIPAGSYTLSIMANAHRIGKIVGAISL